MKLNKKKKKAFLVLQDKTVFEGYSFGQEGYTEGEVVFNTGMTGYQEILTDPSYSGQIVAMTYPQIGNYGYIADDIESDKIQVRGFIVREFCDFPNNYRSQSTLDEYLKEKNITCIYGIDTRALTKKLRNSGTMTGFITTEEMSKEKLYDKIKLVQDISKIDLVKSVTTAKEYTLKGKGLKIGILDYGLKHSITHNFYQLGHNVTVMPALTSPEEVLSRKFDLVFFSNGPGDPRILTYAVQTARDLMGKIPICGICLGHQILGQALGAQIFKLKFGHRGGNHPVKNLMNNKVWITTQNHGYAVDPNTLPKNTEVTHTNLNDNTVEGLICREKQIYTVQFHPEAGPGPQDCYPIFQEFIDVLLK